MVKFLESEPSRTDKIVGAVGDSIAQLIQGYTQKKQSEQLADLLGIPGDKREAFSSLPPEWQKTYATMFQKEQASRQKSIQNIPHSSAKYLKEFHPSLYENPSAKRKISELSKDLLSQGLSENEAIEAAINQYRSPQGKVSDQEQEGTRGEHVRQPYQGKSLLEMFTTPKEGGKEGIIGKLARPTELSGGQMLGALGLGTAAPIEEVLRYQSKPGMETAEKLGFTYRPGFKDKKPLITEKLREKLYAGLSPQDIETAQAIEFAGALIPAERLLGGLVRIGKEASFLKNAEKIAASEGMSTADAVKSMAKEAEAAGVDLNKVAAGDRQEAGKFFNLSNRVSKRTMPPTPTEMRVARAEPKAKMYPTEERIATREQQLKSFPKYAEEIERDAAERLARQEAKIPKTVKGMDAQKLRIHEATKRLPAAQEGYAKSLARVRALEDEMGRFTGAQRKSLEPLLDAAKAELKDTEYLLKQTMNNVRSGEARVGLEDMRKAAQQKMLDISDTIRAGEEVKLAKMDYNPEMVKQAEHISKKKPLPAVKQDDFYQQVHKEYGDQYRAQLKRIEDQLKQVPKSMGAAEEARMLQKERDVLKKLIDQTEAERTIHRHKLGLRETAERQKAKERLAQFEKQAPQPKVTQVAKSKIEEAVRNPSGKAFEEVAASANVKPEELKSTIGSFKDGWKKVQDKLASPKGGNKAIQEAKKFLDLLGQKEFIKAFKTPAGKEILYSLGTSIANDVLGTNVNPLVTAAVGRSQRLYPLRLIFTSLYKKLAPKRRYLEHQYKRAIEREDDETVARIKKEHPKIAKSVRKSLS